VALSRAGEAARGATLYVTLEPCSHFGKSPPCADAVIEAGLARVVSALEDPNPKVAGEGHRRLRASGITVDVGIGAAEARRDHAGHITRMREGRPHVLLKLAVSADGKAGAAGRRPVAITGEAVRERVHLMRAQSDAIMVGIGTVLADDPMLTCRLPGMTAYSPVRIVLDSTLRLPLASRLVESARDVPVWVIAGADASRRAEETMQAAGVVVLRADATDRRLEPILALIAERGITRLMVEGGPTLAAAFVKADLVDQAVSFQSSTVIGPDGIDALEGLPLTALTQSPSLRPVSSAQIGTDRQEILERCEGHVHRHHQ
jgi:diaminohydroxyphosphoribosylaminopyrimidine deaminase/5-amino-6-(5-phosphoribosylamino)uracil reductase